MGSWFQKKGKWFRQISVAAVSCGFLLFVVESRLWSTNEKTTEMPRVVEIEISGDQKEPQWKMTGPYLDLNIYPFTLKHRSKAPMNRCNDMYGSEESGRFSSSSDVKLLVSSGSKWSSSFPSSRVA